MRLWHFKLIEQGLLPNSQLIAQWRELNSIYANKPNHILINYVYQYPKENLLYYSVLVANELHRRNVDIKMDKFEQYFSAIDFAKAAATFNDGDNPFPEHHTDRYLIECYWNLAEKFDRGQRDFFEDQYNMLTNYVFEGRK